MTYRCGTAQEGSYKCERLITAFLYFEDSKKEKEVVQYI